MRKTSNDYKHNVRCYKLGIGLRAAIMVQGQGSLWMLEGQHLGHTTTSKINLFINWLLGYYNYLPEDKMCLPEFLHELVLY